MRVAAKIGFSLVLSLLCSCRSVPTAEELATADYGPAPSEEEAKAIVNAWLENHIRGEDSVKEFQIGKLVKGWLRRTDGDGYYYGHWLQLCIDFRKVSGYFAGRSDSFLFIRNGKSTISCPEEVFYEGERTGRFGRVP